MSIISVIGMAVRGVMVNTSAFIASICHQCYSAGLGLGWGLNFRALVCSHRPNER